MTAAIALLVLAAAPSGVSAEAGGGKISGGGGRAGAAEVVPGQYAAAAAAAAAAADDDIAAAATAGLQVPNGGGVGVSSGAQLLGDQPLGADARISFEGGAADVASGHYAVLSPAAAAAAAADVAAAAASGPQAQDGGGVALPSPRLGADAGDENPLILPSEGGAINESEPGNQTKTRSSHPVMRLAGLGDGRA